ncbi:hypothetical protein SFRURICE_011842 [Spodoptera frugiperda]|nr:hypothetical protein SFRURICE_011842 [Spodoptera frugiperda]
MLTHPMDKFVILGDFNFGKNVDWCHSKTNNAELVPLNSSGEHIIKFFDTVQTYGLSQYNGQLRVTENADPLDIPIDSHHKPLLILAEFVEIHKLEYNITNRYHYSICDYSAITSELDNVNWTSLLHKDYMSIEDAVANFYNKLYEVRDKHIPLKSTKLSTYPPWYNTALIKILKEKYKYHQKYKTYGNLSDYHSFSILRTRAKDMDKKCFDIYIEKIESSIIKNPKAFWSYVKSRRKSGTFPNVMQYNDITAHSGEEISNLRELSDVCFLINIATGAVDCPELLEKVQLRTNHIGFRRRPLLHVPSASTKYRRNAFFLRSARSFNSLPRDLDIDLFCTKSNVVRRRLAKLFFC